MRFPTSHQNPSAIRRRTYPHVRPCAAWPRSTRSRKLSVGVRSCSRRLSHTFDDATRTSQFALHMCAGAGTNSIKLIRPARWCSLTRPLLRCPDNAGDGVNQADFFTSSSSSSGQRKHEAVLSCGGRHLPPRALGTTGNPPILHGLLHQGLSRGENYQSGEKGGRLPSINAGCQL